MKPFAAILLGAVACSWGCAGPSVRSQSPEEIEEASAQARLLGEYCVPHQMSPLTVEAVALVTGLAGTGGDPPPSPQRSRLLEEMKTRGVKDPNQVLASPDTTLVLVRGYLRPGIQKGDHFDLEIRTPSLTETTSLAGGWLMETRLQELAVLQDQIREGSVKGIGQGPLLVDPATNSESDKVSQNRARILGGGISRVSRPVALVVKPDYKSVHYSSQIAVAVNRRFSYFEQGIKTGVANAKDDQYIELIVHPRYKDNLDRYLRVVRSIPMRESAAERVSRVNLLERQLLDPVTSARAAIRLEALGREGVDALKKGLLSSDREVRFYAAEALAYLDESSAAEPLALAARDEPAFRVFALAALGAMDDVSAYDQLRQLLDTNSAETRYGAFRALWTMNPADPLVRGESLNGRFSYHVLPSTGTPLLHATRSFRPELVMFGQDQKFTTPLVLEAGPRIMVNSRGGDEVTVSRFAVGEPDQKRVVSSQVDAVIRAVAELGATYPDVVQMLQQAKQCRALDGRFEVDALPEAGRTYHRRSSDGGLEDESRREMASSSPADKDSQPDAPRPDLFDPDFAPPDQAGAEEEIPTATGDLSTDESDTEGSEATSNDRLVDDSNDFLSSDDGSVRPKRRRTFRDFIARMRARDEG